MIPNRITFHLLEPLFSSVESDEFELTTELPLVSHMAQILHLTVHIIGPLTSITPNLSNWYK